MTSVSCRFQFLSGAIALVAALWWVPTVAAPASETTRREFEVGPNPRLSIQNGRGDITIDTWQRRVIGLTAVKTIEGDAVAIDVTATADQVAISSRPPAGAPPSRTKIDYQLRVPADTDLRLIETARGRVRIAGIVGRAVVHVDNGPVRISNFAGTLDATATNGDVDATLARATSDDSIKLETFNGDIRLHLPDSAAPHFEIRALNGTVSSQLPLKVESLYGPQIAHSEGAAGGPFVSLVAITGDIRISHR